MNGIWNEKTLKTARMIVVILASIAAALSTITATLAAMGVDVSVLVVAMTICDGLAAAVAAFFGIKKNEVLEAQKLEIATLKAEAATAHNLAIIAQSNGKNGDI